MKMWRFSVNVWLYLDIDTRQATHDFRCRSEAKPAVSEWRVVNLSE